MKLVITARDFSTGDPRPLSLLNGSGLTIEDHSTEGFSTSTSLETMYDVLKDADLAISGLEPYPRALIERLPNLKLISRRSIGYDSVDLDACRDHGVTVCRALGAIEGACAELVMAYVLYFARRVHEQNAQMQQGVWQRNYTSGTSGKTLGLVGFGGIGKEVALRAVPFGMRVLYYCRHPRPEWEEQYRVHYAPLDQLLAESDYVSANMPLTDETRRMFNAERFAQMKPGSVFINTARGPVMDAKALRAALESGHLAGAGVDAYDSEPCTDSPLAGCPNAVLTPHTASFTNEAFTRLNEVAAQNLLDFLAGHLSEKNRLV